MQLQFIGSGDAFGSGGRFNTCFHVTGGAANFLIDCGATSLVGMKRLGIDRNAINTILLTHFPLDHFGGVPFFILDSMFAARRTAPLRLAGPPGLRGWYERLMAATFPGERTLRYELAFQEMEIGRDNEVGGLHVTPFHMRHDDRAGPCLGYRISLDGKTLAYSGDTEWTDALIDLGRDADLFICECYTYERVMKVHLALKTLEPHLPAIGAKRLILTHMSDDMLSRLDGLPYETATDGKTVEI